MAYLLTDGFPKTPREYPGGIRRLLISNFADYPTSAFVTQTSPSVDLNYISTITHGSPSGIGVYEIFPKKFSAKVEEQPKLAGNFGATVYEQTITFEVLKRDAAMIQRWKTLGITEFRVFALDNSIDKINTLNQDQGRWKLYGYMYGLELEGGSDETGMKPDDKSSLTIVLKITETQPAPEVSPTAMALLDIH